METGRQVIMQPTGPLSISSFTMSGELIWHPHLLHSPPLLSCSSSCPVPARPGHTHHHSDEEVHMPILPINLGTQLCCLLTVWLWPISPGFVRVSGTGCKQGRYLSPCVWISSGLCGGAQSLSMQYTAESDSLCEL